MVSRSPTIAAHPSTDPQAALQSTARRPQLRDSLRLHFKPVGPRGIPAVFPTVQRRPADFHVIVTGQGLALKQGSCGSAHVHRDKQAWSAGSGMPIYMHKVNGRYTTDGSQCCALRFTHADHCLHGPLRGCDSIMRASLPCHDTCCYLLRTRVAFRRIAILSMPFRYRIVHSNCFSSINFVMLALVFGISWLR